MDKALIWPLLILVSLFGLASGIAMPFVAGLVLTLCFLAVYIAVGIIYVFTRSFVRFVRNLPRTIPEFIREEKAMWGYYH
jgi:hypothetical protein